MLPSDIIDHCADKGKAISLMSLEGSPNLFTADNARFVHRFEYRGVDCFVLVPYKGEGLKRFWAKLLRYVRKEKHNEDDMWENGIEESVWERRAA